MSTIDNAAAERVIDGVKAPAPGTWAIDADHTTVEFVARHLLTKVRGSFNRFGGEIVVAEDPTQSRVDVRVEAASVRTDSEQRNGHLLSADFFDVERYPDIRFASTDVARVDGDTWHLRGDLTIKDVTRPVTLTFTYLGMAKDPWGNDKAAFSAFTEVDREEWGLTWNAALETGGFLVGRTVRLEFEIQAARA